MMNTEVYENELKELCIRLNIRAPDKMPGHNLVPLNQTQASIRPGVNAVDSA